MARNILSTGLFLSILVAGAAGGAVSYDDDTLEGMDAVVRSQWVSAVEAFGRAAEAAPDDEVRAARLASARSAGSDFWAEKAGRNAEGGRWGLAATCAAVALHLDPDRGKVRAVAERIAKERPLPEDIASLLVVCPAYPGRSLLGRLAARESLGESFGRAEEIVAGCLDWLAGSQEKDGRWRCMRRNGAMPPYDTGVTALAALAPLGEGPSGLRRPRGEAVRKAVAYLAGAQRANGSSATRPRATTSTATPRPRRRSRSTRRSPGRRSGSGPRSSAPATSSSPPRTRGPGGGTGRGRERATPR